MNIKKPVEKIIIVLGCSSGIGRELALLLAKTQPCILVLAARRKQRLEELAGEIQGLGRRTHIVQTDVAKEKECKHLVQETVRAFGRLDALYLCSGISMHTMLEDLDDTSVLRRLMEINYLGYAYTTYYALPYLRQSKDPQIVVIGSLSGETGVPLRTGYCASKFAVNGFFDALRCEVGDKIAITIVSPNYVDTEIRQSGFGKLDKPVAKMMSAEACAQQVLDAADQKKRKVVMTYSGKLAVALRPFWPELVDRVVSRKSGMSQKAKL